MLATGGAERCSAVLSNFFVKNNCNVHHVIVQDCVEYQYSGALLNLGKLKKSDVFNVLDRLHRLKVLYKFFRKNKFDFIIDTRVKRKQFQEFFIVKYIFNAPLIVVIHSFMTDIYFPKSILLGNKIYVNAFKIISVSKAINQKVAKKYIYRNIQTIYNPIDFEYIDKQKKEILNIDYPYIMAVGSMNESVKQFDVLMNCYTNSDLPKNNIKLLILGDGKLLEEYKLLAKKLNQSENIIFKGKIQNPFPYYKNAIVTVLTSKNEGFPTVLLESLACETPIVSFNCESGPNEILINHHNGILVENQNKNQLIDAINEMVSNKNLYLQCKKNARSSVEQFSIIKIGAKWLELFNEKK